MQLIWSQPLLSQHKKKAALSRKKLVVLTGAGISAESGLKTFRDSDGLWEGYDIEEVATYHAWQRNPVLVLDFYNARRRDVVAAQPNAAHKALAELESHFYPGKRTYFLHGRRCTVCACRNVTPL